MANDFLSTYAPLANDIATRTGVDPSVVLGIIDTETGGGKHVVGSNIFGISPSGPQGQYVARYPDVQTASEAFINLMQTPRYRGVAAAGDPASQSAALVKGGYNTANPQYASIVANKALSFGKQLGYQDNTGGGAQDDVPIADAQPAPQPQATTGSAKDRVLSDPALSGGDGASTAPAQPPPASTAKDRVLNDPTLAAPAATTTTQETVPPTTGVGIGGGPAESALDTVKRWFGAGGPPAKSSPLADVITSPDALAADRPAGEAPPSQSDVVNALQPAPNTTYGNLPWVWLAQDDKTGAMRFAMPNSIRDVLTGNVGPETTVDPETSQIQYGMTPGASVLLGFGAGPLRFSGNNPLVREPPGLITRPLPVTADELTAAVRRAGEMPPKDDIPTTIVRPGSTGESQASIEASGGYKPGAGVSGPTEGGAPQPAGAQVTPGYEAIHTPAEEAAYRATAEGKKLLEPQIIGERDTNQYITGETVNNAEREQTVKTARELKELGIRVPEASDLDKEAAQSNNTARTIYAENTAKGPVEIANRNTQRQTDIEADKKTVFAPDNVTGPVDHAPIVDKIREVLNKPENRQNDAVQTVLRPLIDRLQEEGGAGKISDPREMWGLRQQIDRWTSKRMQSDDNNLHYAAHELGEVSDVMDKQIEKAAPGYDAMIAKYAEHSRAIDEMTVLQGALKNLRGPSQTLTYNDFQRFMKNVVDSRMTPSTDLNAFKAISPENMQRLWNIRDSLRRTASAKELARAAGSDTMPNIIDALKGIGKMGGTAALHAYVGAHLGPGGNFALQSLSALGKSLNDRRMIRRATQQMQNLLRPTEPLRVPPGQENPLSGAPSPP